MECRRLIDENPAGAQVGGALLKAPVAPDVVPLWHPVPSRCALQVHLRRAATLPPYPALFCYHTLQGESELLVDEVVHKVGSTGVFGWFR